MRTLSIRLPDALERRLGREADTCGTSRSELAREAIAEYLEERERARFLAEIADEARRLKGEPETLAVAEEFLPLENEALEVAEGPPHEADAADSGRWWE
jgi:predicted DNA-binding protein